MRRGAILLSRRLSEHPIWVLAVGLATLTSALVAVSMFIGIGPARTDPTGPSSAITATSDGLDLTGTEANPAEAAASNTVGTCLGNSLQRTPCGLPHFFEVFSASPCTYSELVAFLGGSSSVEVLLDGGDYKTVTLDGNTVCALAKSAEQGRAGTAKDILQTSRGDDWRRCIDRRINRQVACSKDHTGEIVHLADGAAEPNCLQHAEEYMKIPIDRVAPDLSISIASIDNIPACVVEARGNNILDASLRSIGTRVLPIKDGS